MLSTQKYIDCVKLKNKRRAVSLEVLVTFEKKVTKVKYEKS